jgi:hypothetical protein
MFKLKKKRCTVGIINNRIERHGDKEITAFDIPISMLLDPDQLDSLVGNYTHKALFNTKGKVSEPMFPDFDSFGMKHDLEGETVTLGIGNGSTDYEIEFEDVRLKGLVLEPLTGGETSLTFKLQVCPQTKHIVKLIDSQNCEVRFSCGDLSAVESKKAKQQTLPLGGPIPPGAEGVDQSTAAH